MHIRLAPAALAACVACLLGGATAGAQPLGTFTWQLQPFCNVVTVNVTQQGAVYTMDGFDDQCGAARRAAIVGLGTPNPDGTIGFGWNIVTTPGGRGVQVDARITLPSASGSWSDSAGNAGTLALGASTGGTARPLPAAAAAIPSAFSLLTDGGFLARGTLSTGLIPASGPGARMMWHPGKAAFRVGNVNGGQWDDANVGAFSVAMGFNTIAGGGFSVALGANSIANGSNSTALGSNTVAIGSGSTAMGQATSASGTASTAMGSSTAASAEYSTATGGFTRASGQYSTAMGANTVASGGYSTAMGAFTTAGGEHSTALGRDTTASGPYSLAAGLNATAAGGNSTAIGTSLLAAGGASVVMGVRAATATTGNGSFVYGDQSTGQSGTVVTSSTPNQFLVRAAGGVTFFTNGALTSGVTLAGGGSGWGIVSDVHMKEHFQDVGFDDILAAIARMPVRTWSYKTQDASIRHMGPTAQDFHAAFGLGESDLRINTIDADGVALAAVKALEVRTRALTRENDELRARLARLEALLDKR